ncbi:discoidin domain-containing protein [Paenibacillus sp. PL91]|uniref:discoidin domain-containing protein n=1 Tax=Paenibacillus sp. PL91 TaxID=2729538 RepID=UPI00294FF110|nr:discoidin domain-containing protein [Paenibacillus sp. PL91]
MRSRPWIAIMLCIMLVLGVIPLGNSTARAEEARNIAGEALLTVDSVTGSNTADKAVDGDKASRWVSGSGTYEHIFEMTWEKEQTINQVKVWSGNVGTGANNWHFRDFTLDYWNGSAWLALASIVDNDKDNNAGEYNDLQFDPVTTSRLRLHITKPSWGGFNASDDKIARLAEIEVNAVSLPIDDQTPPGEIGNLQIVAGDGQLALLWTDPSDQDLSHILMTRENSEAEVITISKGVQKRILPGLTNGEEYVFRLQTVDETGNVSAGTLFSGTPLAGTGNEPSTGFERFITRSGDQLWDGTSEFRFISLNGSNLTYIPSPEWHRADAWEQEDVFKSLEQMGGAVVRLYTFTIKGGTANGNEKSHINGLRDYDEDFFRDLDKVLELANRYGIRVIIPFIDTWEHVGGIKQFAALRGKAQNQFYTDPELKEDYKHLVQYVLNRTNTYTGLKYKDDKAVLAWETGNELYPTDEWTQEMSAYIKSIDANHLVMDGSYGIRTASLNDPNVDIVSNHYYESGGANYAMRNVSDRNASLGKKALIIGEFGHSDTTNYTNLLDKAISNGTSGALLWTLKFHHKEGGFYNKAGDYRWPGFPSGDSYDETSVMQMIREKAFEIRGLPVPPIEIPDAPYLLPIESVLGIYWRGSAGAKTYVIERAEAPEGPWIAAGADVLDSDVPFKPFQDTMAVNGSVYYYRVKAENIAGISGPSNVVGPITASTVPPVPDSPAIIPFQSVSSISWETVKWADTYDVERANAPEGPWTVVGTDLSETDRPFKDALAGSGTQYFYRIKAKNSGGISEPSEAFGPIIIHNVAQLAELTADSINGTNVKENAVDGSLATRWLSQGNEEVHFLKIEWASPQTINQLKMWSGAASGEKWHIRDFNITYFDGGEWKPLITVTDNDKDGFYGKYNHFLFDPIQTTAIQLNITKPTWGGVPANPSDKIARLMEFEASYADRTPPVTALNLEGLRVNGWYAAAPTLALNGTDKGPSGVKQSEYSLDGGVHWTVYSGPVALTKEGQYPLLYRSVDHSDNVEEAQLLEVKTDLTAPVVTFTGEASYAINQTITIACSATDALSGVYGTPCDNSLLQVKAYSLEPGEHKLAVTAEDMAGHRTSAAHAFTVSVTFESLKAVTTELLQATDANGWEGIARSLKYKLDQAKAAVDRGDRAAAEDLLASYVKEATDQNGRSLKSEQTSILIRWAQTIIA